MIHRLIETLFYYPHRILGIATKRPLTGRLTFDPALTVSIFSISYSSRRSCKEKLHKLRHLCPLYVKSSECLGRHVHIPSLLLPLVILTHITPHFASQWTRYHLDNWCTKPPCYASLKWCDTCNRKCHKLCHWVS